MTEPTPTRDDKLTCGLWTVGWQAKDPFGDPTRDPIDPVETCTRSRPRRIRCHLQRRGSDPLRPGRGTGLYGPRHFDHKRAAHREQSQGCGRSSGAAERSAHSICCSSSRAAAFRAEPCPFQEALNILLTDNRVFSPYRWRRGNLRGHHAPTPSAFEAFDADRGTRLRLCPARPARHRARVRCAVTGTVPRTISPRTPPRGAPDDPARVLAEHRATPDARAAALLAEMTLEEKLAQLGSAWVGNARSRRQRRAHAGCLGRRCQHRSKTVTRHGLGHLTRPFGTKPQTSDRGRRQGRRAADARSMNGSRLGIPAIAHEECLTGFTTCGATVYPAADRLGAPPSTPSSWSEMAAAIGSDMRAVGVHQGLSPVLDVVRDYRWGRVEETLGEDPYLVAHARHRLRPGPGDAPGSSPPSSTSPGTPPPGRPATTPPSPWGRASSPTSSCRRSRWRSARAAPGR